ncbi:major facilitator superfamily domain-containing protein [Ilyonectria destructans]|nr:major facilitator superfamily domain-containing protein [Ilyonectria destructans]
MSLFMSRPQDDEYPLTDNPNHSYILSTSSLNTPVNGSITQSGYNSGDETAAESEPNRPLPSDVDIEARIHHAKTDEPPYHVFSKRQKWNFVYLVSLAGSFSPLSSNIYFPAINTISLELGVGESLIALTITVYMVVQGIAPSIFGAVSDTSGRRLTFAIVLTIYTAANLALSFTANYPMLLALRGLQAAGSAATISISTGVIADMASPSERGSFIGTNAGIRMMGQAIGPVIGGLLNSAWGFRSIFWMLFAFSLLVLILLLVFLPETQRKIAGNGSIPLAGFHKAWIYYLRPPKEWANSDKPEKSNMPPFSLQKIIVPLKYVVEKDIFVLLSWGALVYALWSMVTSSTTTVLLRTFPDLKQWEIGLCFLPNGFGCVFGSLITGRLLDKSFKQVEARYKEEHGLESVNVKANNDFPIEHARLPLMPYFSVAFIVAMGLYGPSYEFNDLRRNFSGNLVASLGLQFFIAFTATAIFNINSTMLVDCFPDGAGGATATNNLFRCLLGAVGVSVIQPLIDAVKIRNAFLILTAVVTLFSPLVWVQWKYGRKWRLERERKAALSAQ